MQRIDGRTVTTTEELTAIIERHECFCGHGRRQHNDSLGGCAARSVRPGQERRQCPCGKYDVPRAGEEREVDYYRSLGQYAL